MRIRNLCNLVHQQKRIAVWQKLHDLVGIKDTLVLSPDGLTRDLGERLMCSLRARTKATLD
jgi:hypothetical protein